MAEGGVESCPIPIAQASSLSNPRPRQIVEAMEATWSECSIRVQIWSFEGAKKTWVLCFRRLKAELWMMAVVSR